MNKTKLTAGVMSALLLMSPAVPTVFAAAVPSVSASYEITGDYQVEVTANSLNIRQEPNKNSAITGILYKGNKVTITAEQKDSRGVTWGKLSTGKGWINLDFTSKGGGDDQDDEFQSYSVTVTANSLNIRKSANKDSAIQGVLKKGDKVTIVAESQDSRGVTWGKLSTGKGWINLDFTSKGGGDDQDDEFQSYSVTVIANSLNIRKSANKDSAIQGVLKKGDKVTIVAESKDSRGVTWGKLSTGKGWINLGFTSKGDEGDDGEDFTKYQVKVTASSLNIRKAPTTASAVAGVLAKGDVVTIAGEQTVNGVSWGKLDNGQGWICLKYTTREVDTPDFAKYQVKVTASSLNIRASASKSSAIKGVLKKGAKVTIVAEQKDSRGVTWGKLESGAGWISLRYTEKVSDSDGYAVEITANSLNIRKEPNKNSEIVGFLKKGNVFTIVAEQKDSRGVTWGKLENGDGWINLDYTKRV